MIVILTINFIAMFTLRTIFQIQNVSALHDLNKSISRSILNKFFNIILTSFFAFDENSEFLSKLVEEINILVFAP